ncbi:MAG: 30S ribosomal protein S2 [Anaerolineae bacterium]|nr:30S ribosomal protein S2 [Anaerolineae bacterium]
MTNISMKALLETGVHFGHRTRKWNPKMKPYIFTERNGIHILDLHQTLKSVKESYDLISDKVREGGSLMFVGTKRQAQDTIAREATRCGMPYVNERWLGGTLTNWRTIRQRIEYLKGLEARRDRGEFELLTKKEGLMLSREMEKLNARLGGIREMKGLPSLLFVVDVRREYTAIREASILNIPVIAMVDTNSDPDMIDYVIPANDDAIRAIKLVTSVMADAVLDGIAMRKDRDMEEGIVEELAEEYDYEAEVEEEPTDEDFLGQATLAKLRSGALDFGEEEGKAVAASDEGDEAEDKAERVAAGGEVDEIDDAGEAEAAFAGDDEADEVDDADDVAEVDDTEEDEPVEVSEE